MYSLPNTPATKLRMATVRRSGLNARNINSLSNSAIRFQSPAERCMSVGAALIIAFFASNGCNSGPVAWLSNGMMMAKFIQDHANVLIHFHMDCNVKIMVAYALHGNCFAWYH